MVLWDAIDKQIARDHPVFVITKFRYRELWTPPILDKGGLPDVFGRVPKTQNPPQLSREETLALIRLVGLTIDFD